MALVMLSAAPVLFPSSADAVAGGTGAVVGGASPGER
jgi:hypothetical protein